MRRQFGSDDDDGVSNSGQVKEVLDMHPSELEDALWAQDVADRWEASDQQTRPLSEIADELGL